LRLAELREKNVKGVGKFWTQNVLVVKNFYKKLNENN
tara:strand:+ start:21 stop:131 length:111 start_codon:yes stop_codon:yes gene_type:complete